MGFSQEQVENTSKSSHPLAKDSALVNILNKQSFLLRESDPAKATDYSQQALRLAQKLNYPKGIALALGNSGWISYRKGDFVKAMGDSYEALKLSEKIGDEEALAQALNNIGAIYYEQHQYKYSLDHFKRALKISLKASDKRSVARSLCNISYIYLNSNLSIDSASTYAEMANKVCKEINDPYLISFALRTKGDICVKQKNYSEALRQFTVSLQLSKDEKNNTMINAVQRRIANVYVNTGRIDEAIRLLGKNINEASFYGFQEELSQSYKVLAEAYYKNGNTRVAYDFLKKEVILHDSIFSKLSSSRIAAIQNKYEEEIKQAQLALLAKESELKQEEIIRQRVQVYALVGGGTLVFLFTVVLLFGFFDLKRSKRKLERQKEELARKNKTIEEKSIELSRLNATKDKLFSIIGHDFRSPIQNLKSLLELFNKQDLSQQEFERYSKDLKRKIDLLYVNMDNLLNWSVMQLQGIQTKPEIIDLAHIAREISDLYLEAYIKKEISVNNQIDEEARGFADREHIRLIVRNLLSNAIKFTPRYGQIKLYSERKENEIYISVEDSGIGIANRDLEKLFVKEILWTVNGTNNEKGLGLGLLLCNEFIKKNNGRLSVRSEVSKGTTFTFSLPMFVEKVKKN